MKDRVQTPLSFAAEVGNIHAVRNLVRAKADVHTQDWWGFTPLHLALWSASSRDAAA